MLLSQESRKYLSFYITSRLALIFFPMSFLYLISLYNYLLFHVLAEMFSIIISICIFVIIWNSKRLIKNDYLFFLGIAYLFIGSIDILHTLTYSGMNIFIGVTANIPTQYWISARYLEGFTLLIATFTVQTSIFTKKRTQYSVLIGYFIIFCSILIFISLGFFPECYNVRIGLTPFKIMSEYAIIFILAISQIIWVKQKKFIDKFIFRRILFAVFITMIGEFCFTLYGFDVYGFFNVLGHLLKIISFYALYRALIVTSLTEANNSLFIKLKQSEIKAKTNEERYKILFEKSPISLWEEDFSEVKKYIDFLNKGGVKDLRQYFKNNPQELQNVVGKIKIINVNLGVVRK